MKTINGAAVIRTDLDASNGVVHVIDRVPYPTTGGNIVDTLTNDPENRFTTLIKALKATKLDQEISDYSSESRLDKVDPAAARFLLLVPFFLPSYVQIATFILRSSPSIIVSFQVSLSTPVSVEYRLSSLHLTLARFRSSDKAHGVKQPL